MSSIILLLHFWLVILCGQSSFFKGAKSWYILKITPLLETFLRKWENPSRKNGVCILFIILYSNLTNPHTEETAMDLNKKFGPKITTYFNIHFLHWLVLNLAQNFFFQIHHSQLCLIRCSKCITEEENICCFGLAQSGIVLKLRWQQKVGR